MAISLSGLWFRLKLLIVCSNEFELTSEKAWWILLISRSCCSVSESCLFSSEFNSFISDSDAGFSPCLDWLQLARVTKPMIRIDCILIRCASSLKGRCSPSFLKRAKYYINGSPSKHLSSYRVAYRQSVGQLWLPLQRIWSPNFTTIFDRALNYATRI